MKYNSRNQINQHIHTHTIVEYVEYVESFFLFFLLLMLCYWLGQTIFYGFFICFQKKMIYKYHSIRYLIIGFKANKSNEKKQNNCFGTFRLQCILIYSLNFDADKLFFTKSIIMAKKKRKKEKKNNNRKKTFTSVFFWMSEWNKICEPNCLFPLLLTSLVYLCITSAISLAEFIPFIM